MLGRFTRVVDENEDEKDTIQESVSYLNKLMTFRAQLDSLRDGLESIENKFTILEILRKRLAQMDFSPTR